MGVQVNTDYQDVLDKVDGVSVAVPHQFHLYMSYVWGDEFTEPTASGFYFNAKTAKAVSCWTRGHMLLI